MAKAKTPTAPYRKYASEETSVLCISRSDPDDVVAVSAGGGRRWTRAEDLLEREWHRNDIALVNVTRFGANGKEAGNRQYVVEPTWSGRPAGEGLRYLTVAEKRWCREENARLLALANGKYPQFGKLLAHRLLVEA